MTGKDFLALAHQRYSVRKFSSRPVEQTALERILLAGQAAPTACNLQPQHILVLRSPEAMECLRRCTPCHFDAPMALLVCYDCQKSWKRSFDGEDSGWVDASIVTTHMMLEAAEMGVGSTWVMYFDPVAVRAEFSLAENLIPVAILPMGYPADDAQVSPMHEKTRSLGDMVQYL